MNTIPYNIYKIAEIKKMLKTNETIISGSLKYLNYALIYKPRWSVLDSIDFCTDHLEFYALSIGWEGFTETGYRSHFFHPDPSILLIEDDIINLFNWLLMDSKFSISESIQLDLFVN